MSDRRGPRRNRLATVGVGLLVALVCLSGCRLFEVDPVAVLASSLVSGPAPLTVGFDLSYSMHPQDRPITYVLDFGDESEPQSGAELGVIVHHTYEGGGTYRATLTIRDDVGRWAADSLSIAVGDSGPSEGIEVGNSAPLFTAPTTDGGEFALVEAQGHVVLLDFWGAWCTPCKNSLPHLDDLVATYTADGLIAVLISTDAVEQDSIDYLAQHDYDDFISVWEPGGKYTPIAQLYGVLSGGSVGIPHTFVLDRQGVIRWVGHPLDLTNSIIEPLL